MKQIILCSLLLMFFCDCFSQTPKIEEITKKVSSQEESRFYVKGYLDYGLAAPNSFKGINNVSTSTLPTNNVLKTAQKGWGQGLKVGVGAGYIVNDFVNFGLDIDYYLSPKILSTGASTTTQLNTVFDGQIVAFTPNVTFKAIQNVDFYPYCRVGITVGLPLGMTNTINNTATIGGKQNFLQSIYTYKSGPALGYLAALGIRKSLTPGFKLFAEIQANNITIQPSKATLTTYQENGVDKLSQKTASEREIEFTNTINNAGNPNLPTQQSKNPFLISRICMQIGLTFRF